MTDSTEAVLLISSEVEAALLGSGVSIEELIDQANMPVEVKAGTDPAADSTGTKDPATIMVASAVVIAALTPILKKIIRSLSDKEVVIREKRLVPVEDSSGDIVRNGAGEPILHWVCVAKETIAESSEPKIALKGPLGIEISFGG